MMLRTLTNFGLLLACCSVLPAAQCNSEPEPSEISDMGIARCGEWKPNRDEAHRASFATALAHRNLPAVQQAPDPHRVVGITAAYAPGQSVSKAQVQAMLAFSPFCVHPPPPGGVSCQLGFKLNGNVNSIRDSGPRGACISADIINIAANGMVTDDQAAILMGLDPAGTYSMDGPIANILFVNDLRLTGRGNVCSARDIACAFRYAGGVLVEKQAALDMNDILKHELGHLHGLDHRDNDGLVAPDGIYVSVGANQLETKITDKRCTHMMKHKPANYSPWFEGVGGTVDVIPVSCQ